MLREKFMPFFMVMGLHHDDDYHDGNDDNKDCKTNIGHNDNSKMGFCLGH